jgi:hypothetical protein
MLMLMVMLKEMMMVMLMMVMMIGRSADGRQARSPAPPASSVLFQFITLSLYHFITLLLGGRGTSDIENQ